MFLLLAVVGAICALPFIAACATPFDVLRARTEDLGPELYVRASWKDLWLNLIPRDSYPKGAGYVRSAFQVGRSEPSSDEETWNAIAAIDANLNPQGACNLTYNQTFVGLHEDTYKPENFGLMGPLICQDDLTMYWQSAEFWEKYFQALEKRNRRSIINRLGNIYRQYVYKASCNSNFSFIAGNWQTQPAPTSVNMTGLNGGNIPTSELTQEMLDATAVELAEEGADEPNSNGWITQGPDGPVFPLYIGQLMSHRLLLNNSELRQDFNAAWMGKEQLNPVIKRLGAARVIKNFRHIINRFPARWTTCTVTPTNYTIGGQTITVNRVNSGTANTYNPLVRVPTWLPQQALTAGGSSYYNPAQSGDKGGLWQVNPDWRDPSLANFESCEVLSPWVMTEEILMPVNSAPGMKLHPQNYFGEWQFVTGNDAVLGIANCTGIQDPLHKQGRHFAEYRHALKPIFPLYGRMLLFARCANAYDTVTCS